MSFPLVAIVYSKPIYLLVTEKYKSQVAGSYIYKAIEKSKTKEPYRKLVIGDSVGRQLFPNSDEYANFNSLCTNQAVSMCGQYLLLNNYINAGNKIDTLYLLFNPTSFSNNLNQVYTFHYFLKPFNRAEYQSEFTSLVKEQIANIPYTFLVRQPYVLTSNWAPDYRPAVTSQPAKTGPVSLLSPVSIEYLKKIKNLAGKHDFQVVVIPTPTSLKYKERVANCNKAQIDSNGLNQMFEQYFENIIYLDESLFSDGIHLFRPQDYTERYLNEWFKYQGVL